MTSKGYRFANKPPQGSASLIFEKKILVLINFLNEKLVGTEKLIAGKTCSFKLLNERDLQNGNKTLMFSNFLCVKYDRYLSYLIC